MSGWLVSPERLREDAPRDSTRWCWWLYDENWQHRAKGVVATQTEALASARTAALNHSQSSPEAGGTSRNRQRAGSHRKGRPDG